MPTLPERSCEVIEKVLGASPNLCDRVETLESEPVQVITVERKTALMPWAGVRTDGSVFNATINEDAEGRWTMTFNSPHPSGAGGYIYQGTGEEDGNRDNPKVVKVDGTDTATSVQIMVTVDDNGNAADIFEDNDFSFIVYAEQDVICDVFINGVSVGSESENAGLDR